MKEDNNKKEENEQQQKTSEATPQNAQAENKIKEAPSGKDDDEGYVVMESGLGIDE